MRKRPTLIVGLAAAVAAAVIASTALAGPVGAPVLTPDGNSQAIGVRVSPKKLSKSRQTPVALEVTTKLTSTTAANGVPSPTVRTVVDFDRNLKLFSKGVPTCDPAKIVNTSTKIALRECGRAKIGSGKASALIPVGSTVFTQNQTVTAFNGPPKHGRPVVLLHAYGTSPVQVTLVLTGVVSNLNKEGYGPRLDVEVPLIAGGTGALTDFQVKIDKKFKYKGKQRSYVSAECRKSPLKARGAFTFRDGQTSVPVSTQGCKKKK